MFSKMTAIATAILSVAASAASAQDYSSIGQTWSSVAGFASASDRSVALQRATAIRTAEQGADPTSIYYTDNYYDNRQNYIETNTGGGALTGSTQIGDTIGEQTYSVGALNTGSTTITIDGDNNILEANNTATSDGCVHGAIIHNTTDIPFGTTGAVATTGLGDGYALPYVTLTGTGSVEAGCAAP